MHKFRQHVELREHENSVEFLIHSNFLLIVCCSKVHGKAQNLQKPISPPLDYLFPLTDRIPFQNFVKFFRPYKM